MTTNVAVPVPAPVVTTKSKVTLADHLELRNLPLATTPAGKNFAIKSLHPADSEIKTCRGPGGVLPTLSIACDAVDTFPFPANAVGCTVIQTPNPFCPVGVYFTDADNTSVESWSFTNTALDCPGWLRNSANIAAASSVGLQTWDRKIEKYRVLAQSVTVDVIAPALSDQGTIVSAQYDACPRTAQFSYMDPTQTTGLLACDAWFYGPPPSSGQLLMGTSAYTAKAREGFYQPLKIGKFKWRNVRDNFVQMEDQGGMNQAHSCPHKMYNYPILVGSNAPVGTNQFALPKPTSNAVGITIIEGTAGNPQVSIRLRFRQVCEILPRLGGTLAPLAEAAYPPDELSYRMISEIAGRMKDAYPASYNDLGKLVNTITNIGKSVLKYADPILDAVGLVPGVGNIVTGIRKGVNIANAARKLFDEPGSKTPGKPPAAKPKPKGPKRAPRRARKANPPARK